MQNTFNKHTGKMPVVQKQNIWENLGLHQMMSICPYAAAFLHVFLEMEVGGSRSSNFSASGLCY